MSEGATWAAGPALMHKGHGLSRDANQRRRFTSDPIGDRRSGCFEILPEPPLLPSEVMRRDGTRGWRCPINMAVRLVWGIYELRASG